MIGAEGAMLYVDQTTPRGRGVFTDASIARGALIERCPVLVLPARDRAALRGTALYDYYFDWGADGRDLALALGLGSLYNHSFSPNAVYAKELEASLIEFVALRPITAGEEILINYNGDPEDRSPLWSPERIAWVD